MASDPFDIIAPLLPETADKKAWLITELQQLIASQVNRQPLALSRDFIPLPARSYGIAYLGKSGTKPGWDVFYIARDTGGRLDNHMIYKIRIDLGTGNMDVQIYETGVPGGWIEDAVGGRRTKSKRNRSNKKRSSKRQTKTKRRA